MIFRLCRQYFQYYDIRCVFFFTLGAMGQKVSKRYTQYWNGTPSADAWMRRRVFCQCPAKRSQTGTSGCVLHLVNLSLAQSFVAASSLLQAL